jgi:hypothetical protein
MAGSGAFPKVAGDTIFANDYNTIYNTLIAIIGTGSGTSGYGATPNSSTVAQNQAISLSSWNNLVTDINNCLTHQLGTTVYSGSSSIPALTGAIQIAQVNAIKDASAVVVTNKSLVAAGQTALVTGVNSNYNTDWNTRISGQFTYQFSSADTMRHFFNAGGNVRLTMNDDNVSSGGVNASKDANWHTLIQSLGSIYFSRANYTTALAAGAGTAGSNVVIKAQTFGTGNYATNFFQAWGQMTTATRIVVSYICNDASTTTRASAPAGYDEMVTIGITGYADYYKSFPAIQGPIPSVTTTQALGSTTVTLPGGFLTIAPVTLDATFQDVVISSQFTGGNGNGTYIFSLYSGTLPTGLTLSAAGLLSGTITSNGIYNFIVRVVDTATGVGYQNYTLNVGPHLTVSPSSVVPRYTGEAVSVQLSASGGTPPYTYSLGVGAVPGLTLSSTGLWSGTPTTVGSYSLGLVILDSGTPQGGGGGNYTQEVLAGLAITPATGALTGGTRGATYSVQFSTANGTAPYIYALASGSLPSGLSLSGAGLISGTCTGTGTASFTIRSTDSTNPNRSITQAYSIAVVAATIDITPASETFTTGDVVDTGFSASGTYGTVTWSVVSGSISGCSFSTSTQRLTGTAGNNNSTGTFTIQIKAQDQYGNNKTITYTQVVNQYQGRYEKVQNSFYNGSNASSASIALSGLGGGGYGSKRRIVIPLWIGQASSTPQRPVTAATMILNGTTYNFSTDVQRDNGSGRLWCAILSCLIPEGAEDGAGSPTLNLTFSGVVGHKVGQVYAVATATNTKDTTISGNGGAAATGIDLKFSNSKLYSVEFRTMATFRTGGTGLNYNLPGSGQPVNNQDYDNSPVNNFDGGDWSGASSVFVAGATDGQFINNQATSTAFTMTKVFSPVGGTGYTEVGVRYT